MPSSSLPDPVPRDPSFPVELIEAINAAVVTAFQELTGTVVVAGVPTSAKPEELAGDLFASITLLRDEPGLFVLGFPIEVIRMLTQHYLPEDVELSPELIADTAGEFANVVAGQAKTMLKGTIYHYNLTPPTVTHKPPEGFGTGFTLPFTSTVGPFAVVIARLGSA